MSLLLAFSVVLLVGVLISGLAHRRVLSTACCSWWGGFLLGDGMPGVVRLRPDDEMVTVLAELALFSVLFTDGQRVGLADLRSAWRLPGRALLLWMPLTFLVTAALGVAVARLPWAEALLVAAVLAPTDPVFAAAIVGREEMPGRLRHLLNVEAKPLGPNQATAACSCQGSRLPRNDSAIATGRATSRARSANR